MLSIFKTPKPNRPNEPDDAPYMEHSNEPYAHKPMTPPVPHQSPYQSQINPVKEPSHSQTRQEGSANTTLGRGMIFNGQIKGKGALQIDGQFIGTLDLDDMVVVGESGQIEGDVHSKLVLVHGKIKGNVTASDKVTINARGTMIGDITAPRVVVSDGAIFKGRIDMESKVVPPQKPAESPTKKQQPAEPPQGQPPVQQTPPEK